ncbi:hypothetical protein [Streptomyces koyangensis]
MDSAQLHLTAALDASDRAFADEEPFTAGGCTHCYGEEHFAGLPGPPHLVSEDMRPGPLPRFTAPTGGRRGQREQPLAVREEETSCTPPSTR